MLKIQETKMDMFWYLDLGGDCMSAYLCKKSELLTKDLCSYSVSSLEIKTKQTSQKLPLFAILY